jgi:tetratricopeptide (TPR) repeat protein
MFRNTQQQEKLAPGTANSYQLGLDAIRTNRPLVAIEALARLDPEGVHMKDWIGYWSVLTTAYHMIGNYKQELKAALKAQKQYPKNWRPLSYKINALAALGDIDEVHKVLEESKAKPMTSYWNPARLMATAGVEFKAHGYGEEAAEMLKQALSWLRQRSPEDLQSDSIKYQLAWALISSQNLIEAESILRDLHEFNPESLGYLGSLGIAAARNGDGEEALRISYQIKNWNKPYPFGKDLFWQAAIAAALGEKEQAIVLLRDAISKGQSYSGLYCILTLEPLWDYPAFIELLKPRE